MPVLNGVRATSTCDEMHFGAVEIFNSGRWGRICAGGPGAAALSSFQMDAAVACRQLGFPFATLLPLGSGNVDQTSASIAWATDVRCTGVEMRLDECIFPEARGSMGALPAEPIAGAPCLNNQQQRFAVVCRMFEIEGLLRTPCVPSESIRVSTLCTCVSACIHGVTYTEKAT